MSPTLLSRCCCFQFQIFVLALIKCRALLLGCSHYLLFQLLPPSYLHQLAARFVVFENEIDLRAHESNMHGTNRKDGGTKIKLEFCFSRREGDQSTAQNQNVPTGDDFGYGLNGEVFVPEALPEQSQQRQLNEPLITNPLHAARTAELRQQAARVRERDHTVVSTSSFPSLSTGDAAKGVRVEASSGMLVGWTADGARNARGNPHRGLKTSAVGKLTQEEFPSLGPCRSTLRTMPTSSRSIAPKFSSVTARPTTTSMYTSNSNSTHVSANIAQGMAKDNFPSLGREEGAPTIVARNSFPSLGNSTNFPTLKAASTNPYTAAQAHARKLKTGRVSGSAPPRATAYPVLSSSSDFPPPPTSKKVNSVKAAFAPTKKHLMMDNVLQCPKPSFEPQHNKKCKDSLKAGMDTVECLKERLGMQRYKRLKSLTRDFALGSLLPESYVDEVASLFDQGVRDEAFWDVIPDLILDIPDNQSSVDCAMQHLESLRMVNEMQTFGFNNVGVGGRKKPINYVLPAKKKTSSWGNNGCNNHSDGLSTVAALSTAKKKESNKTSNNENVAGKKSRAKKKNNELKALAFGGM